MGWGLVGWEGRVGLGLVVGEGVYMGWVRSGRLGWVGCGFGLVG